MRNIKNIFVTLKELNEKYNNTLIPKEELIEEEDNIKQLSELDERMNKVLVNLSNICTLNEKGKLTSELLQLHLVIGEIEWQFDQIHEIVRQILERIEE